MHEVLVERCDAEVEFLFGHDERRGDDEVADPRLLRNAIGHHFGRDLIDDQRLAFHLVKHGVEGLPWWCGS